MKIGNKTVGGRWPHTPESPTYWIAEAGMNHGGSVERAKQLIKAAAEAGADAIKFQTYTADELVCKGTPRFWDFKEDDGRDQWEAYDAIPKLSYDDYPTLIAYCKEHNIEFLSTPFSFEAADKLNEMGMAAFKIASSDMHWHQFLRHIAKFGKPILLSTGASTMEEVRESVQVIRDAGNNQIAVLQCTLKYPTEYKDANFRVIGTYKKEFPDLVVGLSDHTLGYSSSIFANKFYGAQIIEKHFTIDKTLPGNADHWLSVDPKEMAMMCNEMTPRQYFDEDIYPLLGGSPEKRVLECEAETRKFDKRSMVSAVDIKAGTPITPEMIIFKRPGTGIWPNKIHE